MKGEGQTANVSGSAFPSQDSSLQPPFPTGSSVSAFALEVGERSGENVFRCYYCRKCTVGCPTAFAMDFGPAQVLKMIQLGMKVPLLKSSAPWLCVSCEACGTRCPNEIRLAPVMDALKCMALEAGYAPPENKVYSVHRSFLDNIKLFGRVHEVSMLVEYKLRSRDLFSDLTLGALLLIKGKIRLLPERVKAMDQVKELYRRAGQ